MKRAFLWGCLLPVLAACAGGGESRGEEAIFPDPVPVEGKVRLSSILSRYRLIPLQTGDSSLVGAVVKVVKNDGRYYVSDRSDQLSVFDAQGRFLGRIAGRGAGPGEYGRLLDFDVDDRQVVILDYQRLHFYSLDGEYEKTVHMADNGTYVRLLSGGRILLASDSPQGVVCLLERNGEDGRILSKGGNGIISERDLLSFRRERRSFFRMACVRTMCGALGEKKFSPGTWWTIAGLSAHRRKRVP